MATKIEPEPMVLCLIPHVDADGQPVRGGARLRAGDPAVKRNPAYFCPVDLSDGELFEARKAAWGRFGLPMPRQTVDPA